MHGEKKLREIWIKGNRYMNYPIANAAKKKMKLQGKRRFPGAVLCVFNEDIIKQQIELWT